MKLICLCKVVAVSLLVVGLFAAPPRAYAYTSLTNVLVTRVVTAKDGSNNLLMIRLENGHAGEGCQTNTDWIILNTSGAVPENLTSVAMGHYLSGRRITVTINGCSALPLPWSGANFFGGNTRPVAVLLASED